MKKNLFSISVLFFAVLQLSAQPDKGFKGDEKQGHPPYQDEWNCDDYTPLLLGTDEFTWDAVNNDWLKKYVTENIYNDNGQLTETIWKEWETGNNYTRYLYLYNDPGLNIEKITQEWNDSVWVNTIRFIYNLNESGLRKSLLYMVWDGKKWTYYERHVYYFNVAGLYDYYVRYQYVNRDWIGRTINRYYYDEKNNLINRTERRISDKLLTVRYLYTYDADNLKTEYLRQVWQTGQWINTLHVDYYYNDYNLLSENIVTTWVGNSWVNTGKTVYLYDTPGGKHNKVVVCHKGHPICISVNALPAHLAHGDIYGDCGTEHNNTPEKSCKPGSGNKKSSIVLESSGSLTAPETTGFLIYPNPVQDQLTISLADNELNITRADLIEFSGRVVRTVVFSTGNEITIDCNDIPAGIYILKLTGDRVFNEKIVIN
jgi:hypothetical protein